jgi:predicted acyl esterase
MILTSRLAAAGLLTATLFAQPESEKTKRKRIAYTRAHYTKYEYKIPMRDGVKLVAAVSRSACFGAARTVHTCAPWRFNRVRFVLPANCTSGST